MKTYLMRLLGDNSGKLVGIANVHSLADLFDTVDEHCNPNDYEYLRVVDTCVCMWEDSTWVNAAMEDCLPPDDEELEECEECGEEPRRTRYRWKTLVELCGSEEKFWEMYEQVYGEGSRPVAGMMRNGPEERRLT